ncbi:MAG TPA: tyrosine-type recombinase/integrase [Noviherbaspirillum sp.]|nr:tyrosine-type recombinase/integrase [Noviherbaspirillum sp.]
MPTKTLPLFDVAAHKLEEELSELFEAWIAHRHNVTVGPRAQRRLREESADVYREMWQAFARHCAHRGIALVNVRASDIETFLMIRGTGPNPDKPRMATKTGELSARYARRMLTLIDRLSRFDAQQRDTTPNRAAHELLQLPVYKYAESADKTPLPDPLLAMQVKNLIAYLSQVRARDNAALSWKEMRDRTAVALMLGAGLSPADVRTVKTEGIKREGGRRSGIPWKLTVPANGTLEARDTHIEEWAARLLALWIDVRVTMPGEVLFPSTQTGRAWSHTGCFESCKGLLEQAGLGEGAGGLYRLRHSFAVRMLQAGHEDNDIAGWLGLKVDQLHRYRRVMTAPVAR